MTNPVTLPTCQKNCPMNCPFLGMRTFLPETLPFYCNKYDTFLGMNVTKQTLRCAACLGEKEDIVQTGLSFIESYTDNKVAAIYDTKQAFLALSETYQKMFVELVSKTGAQIALPYGKQAKPEFLQDQIFLAWNTAQERAGSPEVQEFKDLLSSVAEGGFPLFSRETQTLLMNLFQVLDNSEKEMLKNVLQNQNQIEAFLEQFSKTPQDNDLLRNTRALLYTYDDAARNMKRELTRQQEAERQQEIMRKARMNMMQNDFQR